MNEDTTIVYDSRSSRASTEYTSPRTKQPRGANPRSEGVIKWHSQTSAAAYFDLFGPPRTQVLPHPNSSSITNIPTTAATPASSGVKQNTEGRSRKTWSGVPKQADEKPTPEVSSPIFRKTTDLHPSSTTPSTSTSSPSSLQHRGRRIRLGSTSGLGEIDNDTSVGRTYSPVTTTTTSGVITTSSPIKFHPVKSLGGRDVKTPSEPTVTAQKDSSLPPLSWRRTPSQQTNSSGDTSSEVSELEVTYINGINTRLPQVQHTSVWNDSSSESAGTEDVNDPANESTLLAISVIKQHHTKMEELLSARLSLLRNTCNIMSRNGGWPKGIAFSLEHVITNGDVVALADLTKTVFSIDKDGMDTGEDRFDIDWDYETTKAWLSALPSLLLSGNTSYVLVALKVFSVVVPTLDHWIDTAVGIARSLGSDAIPDELRAQCKSYIEQCRKSLSLVDKLDRKGRVGVAANEVSTLLQAQLSKSLP